MRKTFIILLIAAFSCTMAYAGGYQVRLQGVKQSGMGLVGSSTCFGVNSMYYNPGALGFMKDRFEVSAGISPIFSSITYRSFESNYTAKTENPVSPPFYVYAAGKITDDLVAGIGVMTPYGSKSVWADDWKGRYLIQNIALKAVFIQPTLTYKVHDMLSIGVGLDYVMGSVELQKALPYNDNSYANLSGDATSMGFNVGLIFKPTDYLTFGIDYRSKVDVTLEGGDAAFYAPASLAGAIPAANKFGATLPLPGNLDVGVSWQATEDLLVAFEVNYVMWGVYDTLKFTFEEQGALLNSSNPRMYESKIIPRIGIQYNVSDKLQLRAGGYYDPTPANSDYFTPETVTLNTIAFTAGLTYIPVRNLEIDVAFLQTLGQETDMNYTPGNFGGKYKSASSIPGLGITYKF
ncbi:MAG: outer membrane protein transport protein [Bacteroidales bacterium]|nr:outer membrane protein transport protein [Bacteroidales bacterium]